MQKVTVFTMNGCPYCEKAKALLTERGVSYEEVRIAEDDDAKWDELYQKSRMRTMPQIFAGERLIGGFSDLAKLDETDALASLKMA